ncbi:LysE family transporter [Desulfosporosinus sp. Sb-LF]|uniref:LysE family transporter n=1 Tax=Desulfosporosinus sp. Sb-LF TaxID=2560027 RepID=UPI001FB0B4AB|nr:LysE family transporter [Desulfosporosinus sp. Sb-LF]
MSKLRDITKVGRWEFVGLWVIFMTSLFMGFSGAIMPGPLLTITINESLHRGARVGPQIVSGHALLELALVVAIFFGLGTYITLPYVKGTIGIVGGLFLFWMAYGILKDLFHAAAALDLSGGIAEKGLSPWVAGITVTASNPYWFLWWATAGAGALMVAASQGVLGAVSFYMGHVLSDYIWYILVAFTIARGKELFTPMIYRIVLGVCGLFLVGLASYFVYSGTGFLLLFKS